MVRASRSTSSCLTGISSESQSPRIDVAVRRLAQDLRMDHKARLKAMYEAFNARDIDAVLHQLTADVDWPNAWEGGLVRGWTHRRAVLRAVG
jgi:hypothetical protein